MVHGNSDLALKKSSSIEPQYQTGWDNTILYFLQKNYTSAELYATTWGPANPLMASQNTHSCKYVMHTRQFINAVLAYTNASKIHIIGHSMGVTLARRAIKGGQVAAGSKIIEIIIIKAMCNAIN